MFDLTAEQEKAARDAMGNVTPLDFTHLIFFTIALAAMVWLILLFYASVQGLQKKTLDIGEVLSLGGFAIFILLWVGFIISS